MVMVRVVMVMVRLRVVIVMVRLTGNLHCKRERDVSVM